MKKALAIIGYILVVGMNLPHLVSTYILAGNTVLPEYYSWATLIVIDFGILVLALNDKEYHARSFATLVFFLNIYFYWDHLPFPNSWAEWFDTAPGLLYSIVPAFFIAYFSELIADLFRYDLRTDKKKLESIRYLIGSYSLTIDNNRDTIDIYRPIIESISDLQGASIVVKGVQSVKGKICKCGVIHKAGSNKENNKNCENCNELIEW